jgi:lipid-A-disaccharide synthase
VTIKFACLLNLLLDRLVVPEYLQEDCRPEALAAAVAPLPREGAERSAQLQGCAEALTALGMAGESPSRRAAREVLSLIGERKR